MVIGVLAGAYGSVNQSVQSYYFRHSVRRSRFDFTRNHQNVKLSQIPLNIPQSCTQLAKEINFSDAAQKIMSVFISMQIILL